MKNLVFNFSQMASRVLLLIMFIFLEVTQCHPIEKKGVENRLEFKDEKLYPNGTIVGKYSYTDREGNPIQVKYYADDSSYGVELKSIKVETSDGMETSKEAKLEYSTQSTDLPIDGLKDPLQFYNPTNNKYKTSDPLEIINKEIKRNNYKELNNNPDYEIYVHNELKYPNKCGKEKVRVYHDKNKRKVRKTVNDEEIVKYCELF